MKIPFAKMHGLGNDFIVINAIDNEKILSTFSRDFIIKIADRRFGIGCDQILILEKSTDPSVDFFYRIFNSDGTSAVQCVNGVRCLAKFVDMKGLINKNWLTFATDSTITHVGLKKDGLVTAEVQVPIFAPEKIPMAVESESLKYNLKIGSGKNVEVGAVSVGNPHAVILVEDVESVSVDELGLCISNSEYFPDKANISFMQILDCQQIKLRVYERGSGETLACGSGACASVVIGKLWGFLRENVVVKLLGGELNVKWDGLDKNILVTGSAEIVFTGEMTLTG